MQIPEQRTDNRPVKRASIRPSPTASAIQLVMGIVFLIFGVVFISGNLSGAEEGRGPMLFFMFIWVIGCLAIIVYSIINLQSFKGRKPGLMSLEIVEMEKGDTDGIQPAAGPEAGLDFETKLRKLEALRRDGILSEDEYRRKKQEILEQKW
jgi:hypothetical protein